ncbi:hypothetical protein SAMN04487988_10192 [Algoriphagus hitonicola]|uniref:Uncharacterized protein n=1 Tax=Algoriphagus hitonicola TaxID=435880 RepID=A0A1I2NLD8_9BACT|nr:hypothetical protein SAMN04487988_10192 [Algoriphagus hitonicola]
MPGKVLINIAEINLCQTLRSPELLLYPDVFSLLGLVKDDKGLVAWHRLSFRRTGIPTDSKTGICFLEGWILEFQQIPPADLQEGRVDFGFPLGMIALMIKFGIGQMDSFFLWVRYS